MIESFIIQYPRVSTSRSSFLFTKLFTKPPSTRVGLRAPMGITRKAHGLAELLEFMGDVDTARMIRAAQATREQGLEGCEEVSASGDEDGVGQFGDGFTSEEESSEEEQEDPRDGKRAPGTDEERAERLARMMAAQCSFEPPEKVGLNTGWKPSSTGFGVVQTASPGFTGPEPGVWSPPAADSFKTAGLPEWKPVGAWTPGVFDPKAAVANKPASAPAPAPSPVVPTNAAPTTTSAGGPTGVTAPAVAKSGVRPPTTLVATFKQQRLEAWVALCESNQVEVAEPEPEPEPSDKLPSKPGRGGGAGEPGGKAEENGGGTTGRDGPAKGADGAGGAGGGDSMPDTAQGKDSDNGGGDDTVKNNDSLQTKGDGEEDEFWVSSRERVDSVARTPCWHNARAKQERIFGWLRFQVRLRAVV